MGLGIAVMIYALARHRFGVPAWLAVLATVPVLYDGFEIQLEHLIMADVPYLFLLTLAVTLLMWNPAGPSMRTSVLIGLLLGIGDIVRSGGSAGGRSRPPSSCASCRWSPTRAGSTSSTASSR
jgi:4-amino-4-deoxy-L-arabinose transferase-like glycosyltransferase